MNYIKWPNDYNRPLSKEEQAIARRLDRTPEDERLGTFYSDFPIQVSGANAPKLVTSAQSWHSPLGEKQDSAPVSQEEEA